VRDVDQCEAIHHGSAGGGDAAEGVVELQRGFGGAELPHAERVFLQAKRGLQFLRRQGDEGGSEQGLGPFLPNGRTPPPGRRRARGDILRRSGRALRGG